MGNHSKPTHEMSAEARSGVYEAIYTRRDVRGQFKPDPIPDEVLSRVMMAAHYAPSVGFMQPWSFMVVKDKGVRQKVHDAFVQAHNEAAEMFEGDKREVYKSLKLEGIMESPVNIVITCDRERAGPVVVGRTHIRTMDLYSSVCAVQNFWLAARSEGLGVGWVSIFHQNAVKEALNIPDDIVPVAYLCVGYVSHFYDKPELETAGWRPRLPIEDLLHFDQWGQSESADSESLVRTLIEDQRAAQKGKFPGVK